jgi:hypothetical protein
MAAGSAVSRSTVFGSEEEDFEKDDLKGQNDACKDYRWDTTLLEYRSRAGFRYWIWARGISRDLDGCAQEAQSCTFVQQRLLFSYA